MDNDMKFMCIMVCLLGLFFVGGIYVTGHDQPIITNANNEAKYQYFVVSDNMTTNKEKFETIQYICNCTFNNETFLDSMWLPIDTDGLVNKCINNLMD